MARICWPTLHTSMPGISDTYHRLSWLGASSELPTPTKGDSCTFQTDHGMICH